MERQEWRVRYDEETDSFCYEMHDEETDTWSLGSATKCVRREGAEEGEGTDYIHYSFLKQIVRDCYVHDIRLHLE